MLQITEELPVQAFPPKPELNRPWRVPGKKKPKKTDKKAAYLGYEHEKEPPPSKQVDAPAGSERPATEIPIPPEFAPPAPVPSPRDNQAPATSPQRDWMKPRIQERRWTR